MSVTGHDSLKTRRTLAVDGKSYDYFSLEAAAAAAGLGDISRLPFSLKVLLENLVRLENGRTVTVDDIKAVARMARRPRRSEREIAFRPARVLMQDLTGVPGRRRSRGDAPGDGRARRRPAARSTRCRRSIWSSTIRCRSTISATREAFAENVKIEFERNGERYALPALGPGARSTISASCRPAPASATRSISNIWRRWCGRPTRTASTIAYPDTLVGTDSHTTMVNGLAVLGWGVGGIEAEAAMLGQPISMLLPEVVGVRLTGKLREGATATDLVLTVTQMLRKRGVVGRFVEFYGPGIAELALADRATIGNMAPEYGATCGFFPIDAETIRYLDAHRPRPGAGQAGRGLCQGAGAVARREHARPGLHRHARARSRAPSSRRSPGRAGRRTASRCRRCRQVVRSRAAAARRQPRRRRSARSQGQGRQLRAAATATSSSPRSPRCTNTSNPSVMLGAGLLAQATRSRARPQGQAVGQDLARAGQPGGHATITPRPGCSSDLDTLGFNLVGYGCTTCIGNSGPLPEPIAEAIDEGDLVGRRGAVGQPQFRGPHPCRRCAPTISPRRRWSSPMRSPAR